MKQMARFLVAFGLCAFIAKAGAHSLEIVESNMRQVEAHVEFVNFSAPDIRLRNSDGSPVSLAGFWGKVLVMSVLGPSGAQAFDLHMALIARLQAMVETARLSDRVYFVSVAPYGRDLDSGHGKASVSARTHGIRASNWQLLYWTNSESQEPAQVPANDHAFDRAAGNAKRQAVTLVIDQTGRLRARFYGFEFAPVNLVVYVGALVNDDHSRHE